MSNYRKQFLAMKTRSMPGIHARRERLIPNGVPRHIKCYDFDQNTIVVFTRMGRAGTNRYKHQGKGYPYMVIDKDHNGRYIKTEMFEAANPKLRHDIVTKLPSKKITFEDLPINIQSAIREQYCKLWRIG